ncbi:MAG TPA: T9SS type A sorting domain-containing protein [Bacteroidota bacterium]|nr:T9SS type A sorting domain-containing protein [Bacteroidota bacterium]
MKATSFVILLIAVSLSFAPATLFAAHPDTVIVPALPPGNLNAFINADTIATGFVKPNTVFLLKPTGPIDTVYWMGAPITVKGSVSITGYVNPVTGHPPVIAPTIALDNSSIGFFFGPQGNDTLTLKGLYFIGTRTDTVAFTGRFVSPSGDSNVFYFDHCILENISGAGTPNLFDTWNHDHNSFYVTNCEFRNNQDDNPQNPGFAWVDPGTYPCDTARFYNNTFFLTGGYVLGSSGYGCRFLDFQHNTIFLTGQGGAFDLYQMHHAAIRNNIFFGVSSAGYPNAWYNNAPGTWGSAVIPIDSLRSLAAAPYNMTEASRHLVITNNAYFWPKPVWDNWTKLNSGVVPNTSSEIPLRPPDFINCQPGMLTNKTAWPEIFVANNDSADPGFNATLVSTAANKMATFIDTCWANGQSGHGVRPYMYQLYDPPTWNGVASGWHTTQGYPVPENLAYSNTAMQSMGSDGYALGDLNWFPSQLATWKATAIAPGLTTEPATFALSQNYPNPFNPSTRIDFTIPRASQVEMKVFNVLGQEVATIIEGAMTPGSHTVTFDASRLASGVYLYRITAGTYVSTKKMVLLK